MFVSGIAIYLKMAGTTGLEPATSAVTGQRSNQLSYVPRKDLVRLLASQLQATGLQTRSRLTQHV